LTRVRFVTTALLAAVAPAYAADGVRRAFVVSNFTLKGGAVRPGARVIYATYGTLSTARDTAILLSPHYMADAHGYKWLIGPQKALDPAKYFVIATELFGNGKSSAPGNAPEPLHDPRFPVPATHDDVDAVHRRLGETSRIDYMRAIIGFSMGAQRAFQWAVSHPDFADRIVVTSATAKTWSHGIVRLRSQIAAIEADPAFGGGDCKAQAKQGVKAFGEARAAWLFSQPWWRDELWRVDAKPGATFDDVYENFHQDFTPGADANDLILQMRTLEEHDVGTTPDHGHDTKRAVDSTKFPLFYPPSETDPYFPVGDARYEA
jgi:homoserine O-acetyltransferase